MIVAEAKPFPELAERLASARNILVAGCGGCVSVCHAGGEHEVQLLAEALRLWARGQGQEVVVTTATVPRQCEPEWVASLQEATAQVDTVVSLGCGVGVGFLAEAFPSVRMLPGLNTTFGGGTVSPGFFEERCAFCGDCMLDRTAGVCPISRCAKHLLNGPCGGSHGGVCEVNPDTPCAWQLIYDRLLARGELGFMEEIIPPKDWSHAADGGPRRVRREDLMT